MKKTIEPKDIVLESALLNMFMNRENFDTFNGYVDYIRILPTTAMLLKDYKKYYELFPEHKNIDLGTFITQFATNWHDSDLDQTEIEYFRNCVFPKIQEVPIEEANKAAIGLLEKQFKERVAAAKNNKELRTILEKYENDQQKILGNGVEVDGHTIDTVDFCALDKSVGIPWFLPALQSSLGSLVRGQFVVITADVNTGKSAFVISQLAETLRHLKSCKITDPVLYFNSEGTEADIFGRCMSNLYKDDYPKGFEEIVQNKEKVGKRFLKEYGALLRVFQINIHGADFIRSKVEQFKPSMIIIDITDVLAPEETPMLLKKVYDTMRIISGKYCPVIGTSQSGDTSYWDEAEKKMRTVKWLKMKHLYGSKPGKGGAADTIIGIGKDDEKPQLRYVSTIKKKRGEERHIVCRIEPIYSLYEELSF